MNSWEDKWRSYHKYLLYFLYSLFCGRRTIYWLGIHGGEQDLNTEEIKSSISSMLSFCFYARQNNGHQVCPTYEYVTLHGKRNLVDVIKVMDLKIGRFFWIVPVGHTVVVKALKTGRRWQESGSEGWDGRRESEGRRTSLSKVGFESGGDAPWAKDCGWPRSWELSSSDRGKGGEESQFYISSNWILSTPPMSKEGELPLQPPERNTALPVPWFEPDETCVEFLKYKAIKL